MAEQYAVIDVHQRNGKLVAAMQPEGYVRYLSEPPGRLESKPSATLAPLPTEMQYGWRWMAWGDDDQWPTQVREKIEQVPMAGQAIYKLCAMMYGEGLIYYRNGDLDPETATVKRATIKKVDDFMIRNRIALDFFTAQAADYRYYQNAFSEIILSQDRRAVTGIYHKPAEHVRITVQNPATLIHEYLLYSPAFACGWANEQEILRIPLYDWRDPEQFFQRVSGRKFAWHSKFPTPGHIVYARPFWTGLFRKDGWMDSSIAVPEIVNAMMRNQISLKYQIYIPESYFMIRYPDWNNYTLQKKQQVFDDLVNKINDLLSGTKNAARSMAFYFQEDPLSGKAIGKVEIMAIDDKLKRDSWVPSSDRADAQIVQGLGLHPSQVGLAPEGGKMGAGSGSDQRESYNTQISINTIDQQIILEPLNWIARYNAQHDPEWDITFAIAHTQHTTTNLQESGMEPEPGVTKIEQ